MLETERGTFNWLQSQLLVPPSWNLFLTFSIALDLCTSTLVLLPGTIVLDIGSESVLRCLYL